MTKEFPDRHFMVTTEAAPRVSPHCVLVDTAEWSDAISTGREREEDLDQGEPGLRLTFDGGEFPTVTINGEDGEVRLVGASEIFLVAQRLKQAAFLACRERERYAPQGRQRKLHRARSHLRLLGTTL